MHPTTRLRLFQSTARRLALLASLSSLSLVGCAPALEDASDEDVAIDEAAACYDPLGNHDGTFWDELAAYKNGEKVSFAPGDLMGFYFGPPSENRSFQTFMKVQGGGTMTREGHYAYAPSSCDRQELVLKFKNGDTRRLKLGINVTSGATKMSLTNKDGRKLVYEQVSI
jgi:hypothetical protein